MKNLIKELNNANFLYYNTGNSPLSDKEYDLKLEQLKILEKKTGIIYSDSPTQKVGSTILSNLNKISIPYKKMLSLEKVKTDAEIETFSQGQELLGMIKCDGLSVRLVYKNGKLFSANTRGNGEIGADITHHAFHFINIPIQIPYKEVYVIDGEAIIKYKDFILIQDKYNFSNPRNAAAGTLNLLTPQEVSQRKISFIAWDVIKGGTNNTIEENLYQAESFGFEVVFFTKERKNQLILDKANELSIPCDGVVWKFNNIYFGEKQGFTSHHFNSAIAWKPYDELYETELINIEWSLGRTGVLTPVAIFKEIEIEGAKINRASLHNVSVMNELLDVPYEGQKIRIFRANQIIPQVHDADICGCRCEHNHNHFLFPTTCPVCGGDLLTHDNDGVKTLWCINKQCPGQALYKLDHFCGKKGLDIKGLSEATLEKLLDWGWIETYKDIFNLWKKEPNWIKQPSFGEKSVRRILDAIGEAHHTTVDKFISSIGIPLIGVSVSKVLAKEFKTWDNFRKAVDNGYEFYKLPDFGPEKHAAITEFNYAEADEAAMFLNFEEFKEDEKKGASLAGMTFVITGKMTICKNRTELKALIESYGGRLVDSVSSKTTYLINNDLNSNTGKNKTAKSLGIPIITESQFKELLN